MARAKQVKYYNNRLQGNARPEDCDMIEHILQLKEQNGVIPQLKNTIYELTDEEVKQIRTNKEVDSSISKTKGTLTDAQTLGVAFMSYAGNCLLGDSVGLGKTVQIASLMNIARKRNHDRGIPFRYLYLTEKTIVSQAINKLIKFTRQYVHQLTGEKKENVAWRSEMYAGHEGGIVAPHSLVTNQVFHSWLSDQYDVDYDQDHYYFDYLIVDEGSIFGNTTTKTYKYAEMLKRYCNKVIILNATPFERKLDVFYSQLHFCDETMLPTKTTFNKLYVKYKYTGRQKWGEFDGYKNEEQFKHQVGYRYFYHTRKGLGSEMKNTHYELLHAPMTKEQEELMKWTDMYGYVYDCPPLLDSSIPFDSTYVPKLELLDYVLDEHVNSKEQILIFCKYKKAQEYLKDWFEAIGYSTEILNGDTKLKDRDIIVEDYVDKQFEVLITSVQKGLDFGDVQNLIFYSFDTNPNKMIQFEGRITRSFNIENKKVFILANEGRELNNLKTNVTKTLKASQAFSSQDLSAVVELLLNVMD